MAAPTETKSGSLPLEEVENMEAKVEVPTVLAGEDSPPGPLEWSKACAVFVSPSSRPAPVDLSLTASVPWPIVHGIHLVWLPDGFFDPGPHW